jgi:hypothetical protein
MDSGHHHQFVKFCKANYINNYHHIFSTENLSMIDEDEPHRQRCVEKLIALRHSQTRRIDDFRRELFLNPENRPRLFNDFLRLIGIDEPGIYEVVGDAQAGKSALLKRMIAEFNLAEFVFLVTNNLDKSKKKPKNLNLKHVFSFKDLMLTFSLLYNRLVQDNILFPVIFVDDFSVLAYELDEIPTYQFIILEFIKICRMIRDDLLGIIVTATLPKKTRNHIEHFGGLITSPWRNAIDHSLYVKLEDKGLKVETIDGFTRKKLVSHVPLSK